LPSRGDGDARSPDHLAKVAFSLIIAVCTVIGLKLLVVVLM
jgi:hypothetical protein